MEPELEAAWYVIRSATRREDDALEALTEAGFPAYMPQGTRWGRLKPAKTRVNYPLFPGYLFVECCPTDFADILDLFGVHDFLRVIGPSGDPEPLAISEALIERISDEETRRVYDDTRPTKLDHARAERIERGYEKGESIVVRRGVYAGFISKVLRMASRRRKVVVEAFGGVLTLDIADVDPIVQDGHKFADQAA